MVIATPAVTVGPARQILRDATREVHETLHNHSAFASILGGTINAAEYRQLLIQLYGFHAPLEEALLAAPRESAFKLDVNTRRRAYLLALDLAALGVAQEEVGGLSRIVSPVLNSPGRALGALYVRDGAMIGGRVLANRVGSLLGSGLDGRRFFLGEARDVVLWQELQDALEVAGQAGWLDDMIAAARATFDTFTKWITQPN
jgi:heme oxygenase (biliverdin-IX-beta and delta-forming)